MPVGEINLDEGWRTLFNKVLGIPFPALSESYLRELGDAYEAVGRRVDELPELFADIERAMAEQFDGGETVGKFRKALKDFPGYIEAVVTASKANKDFLYQVALDVEYTKYMAMAMLFQMLIEIAWCIEMAVPTAGVSLLWIPVIRLMTQLGLRKILQALLMRIVGLVTEEMTLGLAADGVVQRIQIGKGTRHGVDRNLQREAAIGAAMGVVFEGPLEALGHLLSNRITGEAIGSLRQEFGNLPKESGGLAEAVKDVLGGGQNLLGALAAKSDRVELPSHVPVYFGDRFGDLFATHFGKNLDDGAVRDLRETGQMYGRVLVDNIDNKKGSTAFSEVWNTPGAQAVPGNVRNVFSRLPEAVDRSTTGTVRKVSIAAGLVVGNAAFEGLAELGAEEVTQVALLSEVPKEQRPQDDGVNPYTFIGGMVTGAGIGAAAAGVNAALDAAKRLTLDVPDPGSTTSLPPTASLPASLFTLVGGDDSEEPFPGNWRQGNAESAASSESAAASGTPAPSPAHTAHTAHAGGGTGGQNTPTAAPAPFDDTSAGRPTCRRRGPVRRWACSARPFRRPHERCERCGRATVRVSRTRLRSRSSRRTPRCPAASCRGRAPRCRRRRRG
ncbi:hypothetical protein [Streptomyces sp. AK02-01A]|uniref:WXG100-like domain-containing protein n=1 Tax=Streptomyces sp. AK02-01A TaxID=3028648 RepID=UPI0029A4592C|nr:hypothetical protein [Streptomyces sp. AK02-01A]MDX3849715.1 hypothetical protein [Streptomyces sp. AK02-01A]